MYDNNGKDMESCKPLIDAFKGKVEHYVFVSSAGAYKVQQGGHMGQQCCRGGKGWQTAV